MKTEFAARLYASHFLRIVQLQKAAEILDYSNNPKTKNSGLTSIVKDSNSPLHWDESWFANYE